jgi:hypothetical protein
LETGEVRADVSCMDSFYKTVYRCCFNDEDWFKEKHSNQSKIEAGSRDEQKLFRSFFKGPTPRHRVLRHVVS